MSKSRRGRPPGRTAEGEATRRALYDAALELLAERGFEAMTMRALAEHAGVSPGLAYRYFPSKAAIVMVLYQDLSGGFAETQLPTGSWTSRVFAAIRASLEVLRPHRRSLAGALNILLLDEKIGLFSPGAMNTRAQVQGVFVRAVAEAGDAPRLAAEVGRIADCVQLAFILWMLIDRSPGQRATFALLDLIEGLSAPLRLAVRLPGARGVVSRLDAALTDGMGR